MERKNSGLKLIDEVLTPLQKHKRGWQCGYVHYFCLCNGFKPIARNGLELYFTGSKLYFAGTESQMGISLPIQLLRS
jgi:hypothetical protein